MQKEKNTFCFPLPVPVLAVLHRLHMAGYEGFLVGGCVRDFLRGVTPHDYDLTTNALPADMHRMFAGYRLIDTGIKHGTVTVLADGMPIEVTTYRVDGDYRDSRHPTEVRFTANLREDVARRDFTMNALAYHPDLGMRDYVDGCADIAARRIRAVGEPRRRFEEDALRILRALRFSSVLDFSIEEETAVAAHACAHLLKNISAERIHEELRKLLCGQNVQTVLTTYADVLAPVLPAWYCAARGDFATLAARVAAVPNDPISRFTAFLLPLGDDLTTADGLMADLRFDRRTRERIGKLLAHRKDPCTGDLAALRRFVAGLGGEDARLLLAFHWALAVAEGDHDRAESLTRAAKTVEGLLQKGACCTVRDLAVRGEDLAALGCPTGKPMGDALRALLAAVLDGRVENEKEQLLAYFQAQQ
ncbi:MAG: polynucleotide adenylyltransferase [Clostridia bacterium]|nr:polynucleotide adenylyltransferase [Clostridia bacterium]